MAERFQPTPEPLQAAIETFDDSPPDQPGVKDIWFHVGNTGLSLHYFKDKEGEIWNFDYMPDGKTESGENRVKYAAVLAYGIFHFLRWLEEANNAKEQQKVLLPLPQKIEQEAKSSLGEYLHNLLGEAIEVLPTGREGWVKVAWNMEKVLKDKELRRRLERLSRYAEKQGYRMSG